VLEDRPTHASVSSLLAIADRGTHVASPSCSLPSLRCSRLARTSRWSGESSRRSRRSRTSDRASRVLRWADMDLNHGIISITRAWDSREDREKEPKTRNGVRDIPIEPALMPLLERMRKSAQLTDFVVPTLSRIPEDAVAEHTRRHLRTAGITRTALQRHGDYGSVNFRSWRDSGITWLAMSGVPMQAIMSRAGHYAIQTTLGYVKRAEDLSGGKLGQPFAPLPASLVDPSAVHPLGHPEGVSSKLLRRGRDSNPRSAFDRRPLSKRVPSATRSPLLSGHDRSTAPSLSAQHRRSLRSDFGHSCRCRPGALGLYFAARRTTQAVMPPMPSISLNPVFPGPPAIAALSLVTMASGRRMFGCSWRSSMPVG